jgi:Family of unknown function (DUF6152)
MAIDSRLSKAYNFHELSCFPSKEMRTMKSKFTMLVACAALLTATLPALAHHSFAAEYDVNKPCKLTGVVTKFDLTNPHSWIYIDVKDEKGNVVNWGFETANPNSLYRRGYKKGIIMPGMVVTIQGYLAKDGSHTGNAHVLTMEDGKVIPLGSETNPG